MSNEHGDGKLTQGPDGPGRRPTVRGGEPVERPARPDLDWRYSTAQLTADPVVGQIESMILLAGKVAPTPFTSRISRSVLDLPLDDERKLLDVWYDQAASLAQATSRKRLSVRVVIDKNGTMPVSSPRLPSERVELRFERDPYEFRGTAGVVRDLTAAYPAHRWVLVGSASQLPLEPLRELVGDLAVGAEGISMVTHNDGTLAGMMLIKCASLAQVPKVGYVDLKEQALPSIGRQHTVRVLRRRQRTAIPIRTLEDYINALRVYHLLRRGQPDAEDPYAERWQPAFSVIEPGAKVSPTARLQDAVVLEGAVVEDDAVVVRSVVCPGAVVPRRERVIEDLVSLEAA